MRPGNPVRCDLTFWDRVDKALRAFIGPMCNHRCWKLVREGRYVAKYTIPSVQKAEGVMVWCAIKADGSICLRRCPPRVNAVAYRDILESAKAFIRPRCGIPLTWDEASFVPGLLQGTWLEVSAGWGSGTSGDKYSVLAAFQAGSAS